MGHDRNGRERHKWGETICTSPPPHNTITMPTPAKRKVLRGMGGRNDAITWEKQGPNKGGGGKQGLSTTTSTTITITTKGHHTITTTTHTAHNISRRGIHASDTAPVNDTVHAGGSMTYLSIGDVDAQVNVPEAATADFPHQSVFSPDHELPTPDYPRRHGWRS
ncbi:hypothetical protein E2C01_012657 [Portunus trituberculatus]|uniref:Uncharacterized protein n=1 Tax=Portunus trituberculatus TaxID=210409 RepID=A0A5B7DEA0_PORTR|nr:hypothetical protein [Portunus trituberculatus]